MTKAFGELDEYFLMPHFLFIALKYSVSAEK